MTFTEVWLSRGRVKFIADVWLANTDLHS